MAEHNGVLNPEHLRGEFERREHAVAGATNIVIKGSWIGPGRLHRVPHVNAPVADLPSVRHVVGARRFRADLTLPYGRVVHDYNRQAFVP